MSPSGEHTTAAWRERASRAERELARTSYELARLNARRPVRLALWLTRTLARRTGRDVTAERDRLAPVELDARLSPYAHLTVAHLAADPPFGSVAAHRRVSLTAAASPAATSLAAPPALLVLDDPVALYAAEPGALAGLRTRLGREDLPAIAIVDDAAVAAHVASWPIELLCTRDPAVAAQLARDHGERARWLPPAIDPARDSPAGRGGPFAAEPAIVRRDQHPDEGAALAAALELAARGQPVATVGCGSALPGHGPLHHADDDADARAWCAALRDDPARRARAGARGAREALLGHGVRQRLEQVLAELGLPVRAQPRVSVLLATRRPERLAAAVAAVAAQTHADLELVIVAHGDGFDQGSLAEVVAAHRDRLPIEVVSAPASWTLGACLDAGLERANGTLVAKMDDDDRYGPEHLRDLLAAMTHQPAAAVGKRTTIVELTDRDRAVLVDDGHEEAAVTHLPGGTLLVRAEILRAVRWRHVASAVDTHLMRDLHAHGERCYATHRFNYVRVRHGDEHTFARSSAAYARLGAAGDLDTGDLAAALEV